ncbi:hypothetical protein D5045_22240 [Verminephrobacter eiseniae]|uniref:hypothetical protein n=1 Tax=Verminephrobacter eiseniae TaxID=364317 RepID=UPI002237AC3C|nr:hypothetical protein [Verminephrobacter eiseniae]MCW5262760.1 hypothetical protein [Verminephrobacter eiseniae]
MTGTRPSSTPKTALRHRARWWLAILAVLAFALALLRPGFTWPSRVGTTLLVVDITQSMNVADMHGQPPDGNLPADAAPITRLAYTRALLRRVVRELPCGHSAGVGVFTERKTLVLMAPVEVCAHYAALDDVLTNLDWRMAWAADSHIFYGAYSALEQIRQHWPGTALALFTDGHQAPPIFPGREPRFDRSANTPAGALFGVGGLQPQPVPRTGAQGQTIGYWTQEEAAAFASPGAQPAIPAPDRERMAAAGEDLRNRPQRPPSAGTEHLSWRRDEVLARIAEITGLQVHTASDAGTVVTALQRLPGGATRPQRHELHAPLVLLGALALLAGLLPEWRRQRQPLPGATGAGRRLAPATLSRPTPL